MDQQGGTVARLRQRLAAWRHAPWAFRPLFQHSAAYVAFVLVAIPLLAAGAIVTSAAAGVDLAVPDARLAILAMLMTAVTHSITFKASESVAINPGDTILIALIVAGEPMIATLAAITGAVAYAVRTPMPPHHTFLINAGGVTFAIFAASTILFALGGNELASPTWLLAASAATITYFVLLIVPIDASHALGGYGADHVVREGLTTARTETLTIGPTGILAGIAILVGPWWYLLLSAATFLGAMEAYVRTHQYVAARNEAARDGLTGLYNRRSLDEDLGRMVAASARTLDDDESALWIILCDLDNFKRLNDIHGHAVGDEALKTAARALRQSVRANDLCARYGGEEMVVVLPDANPVVAMEVAERIRASAATELQHLETSFSVGLYRVQEGDTPESALHRADSAMYRSKATGKNRVTVWVPGLDDEPGNAATRSESQPETRHSA